MFRTVSLRPSSGVQDCTYSIRYMSYSLELLMMDGVRPSETCRVLFQNKINLRCCASGWFYYRNIQGDSKRWTHSKRWTQFRTSIWYVNDLHTTARALA
jgi:hypothetical protein